MKKPVILVFASRNNGNTFCKMQYTDGILQAGGIPLIVPMDTDAESLSQLCDAADGFLFAGGVDLDPALYGEEIYNDTVEVDPVRDKLETTAFGYVLPSDKPVLGICRGIQSVNVGLGGTLWQDVPSQCPDALTHRQNEPTDVPTHRVKITDGTRLRDIVGADSLMTNSFHHQAVKAPGKGLKIAARTEDGIIEALESESGRFILLLQWHPECTVYDSDVSKAIFRAFVLETGKNLKK
ncbi:MAG: gamma-glutamyl-gamma-aminobutyrate hydrolase family protein [Clostridia bacterium]|nr:gamma-glutamyl-gamma-aminobutyrate hydrolase family protein [Clostridia bacterium]